jgi:glycosyltransferase involved in cell wall biosynthesis
MIFYGWMMFLSVLPALRKLRRNFDFDLIDAHFVYPDGLAAVLLGQFFKKPVVVSARGSDINRYSKFPLIRTWLRYTLTRADRVIAVSQALKETMAKLGVPAEKIKVIPNGVDLNKFKPLPKQNAREALGLPAYQRVILSVGHLTANKGFDLLIRAMKILSEQHKDKNLCLVIVGDGNEKEDLEKLVAALELQDRVIFAGAIAHEELHLWYSTADLFCLASGQEGWPNVLLESLACGAPMVATPVGGIPEIIRSAKIGLLTERNEAKIAETIALALKISWRVEDLVDYAGQHTWERTAAAVRQVFETVLSGKAGLSRGDAACGHAAAGNAMQD